MSSEEELIAQQHHQVEVWKAKKLLKSLQLVRGLVVCKHINLYILSKIPVDTYHVVMGLV